jgi:hypothetical protein
MIRLSTRHSKSVYLAFGIAALLASTASLHAETEQTTPSISGAVAFEFQNDLAFSSDDPTEEFNNAFLKIEPGLTLALTKEFSVNAGIVLEQVQEPPVKGDDRTFADQGLFVEVLTLDYERGPLHFSGGKMHVNFGKAWDTTPGVFGTDLAEEYEMAENIVFLGSITHDFGQGGKQTLSAQTFFLDTSGLAESATTRRKKTREGDGGPGNTGDFSSFAVSLDGGDFPDFPGFSYHAAYVHHANDTDNAESESRFAIGGAYEFKLPSGVTVQPLIEYVAFQDADGTADQDRSYVTAALGFTYGDWNAAISGTFKETEAADGTETNEEQLQVSAGYTFPLGIGLEVAYKRVRNAGVDTDVFGSLLTYGIDF